MRVRLISGDVGFSLLVMLVVVGVAVMAEVRNRQSSTCAASGRVVMTDGFTPNFYVFAALLAL